MALLRGRLVASGSVSFQGYRISVAYGLRLPVPGTAPVEVVVLPTTRAVMAAPDGAFEADLPEADRLVVPIGLTVAAPDGAVLAHETVDGPDAEVRIEVSPPETFEVVPSDDPTLGRRLTLAGRVIDQAGGRVPAHLRVVVWGRPPGAPQTEARPVVLAQTQQDGYFSAEWTPVVLGGAYGVVGTGEPVPVPLTDDGRLPRRIMLVTTLPPARDAGDGEPDESDVDGGDCGGERPPRAPEPQDLVESPETFSTDLGGGRCVDLTVPNRVIEEFSYITVVRTSQPEIKGLTLEPKQPLPPPILRKLVALAGERTAAPRALGRARADADAAAGRAEIAARAEGDGPDGVLEPADIQPAGREAEPPRREVELPRREVELARRARPGWLDAVAERLAETARPGSDTAPAPLEGRLAAAELSGLQLDAEVVRQLLKEPDALDLGTVVQAERLTSYRWIADLVRAYQREQPGRAPLTATNAIDWDDDPTTWQATTVAHGHVLRFRQVWRADGYSLGDLLYSLPLAPNQQKNIAVIDWERRETSARTEQLEEEETLAALVSRDRDIAEIVESNLSEQTRGGSSANVWGAGGAGGGGFLGSGFGIFLGVAGGGGGASSTAWQDSARSLSAGSLQQLRDRTLQSASAVRDQRSTVVQTVAQGETMRVETEVVANYNHCHAMTVEYFEVLRHFQVSQELADVQECLFVPLLMGFFDEAKAVRHRDALAGALSDRRLRGGFDALDRVRRNWAGTDTPVNRYSEETPEELEGELRIRFVLPRPRDDDDNNFVAQNWAPYRPYLSTAPSAFWLAQLARRQAAERDRHFRDTVAPQIAQRLVQSLRFAYVTRTGGLVPVPLDATLVSRFAEDVPLYVSLRPAGPLPALPREEIARFLIAFDGELPPDARVLVQSGAVRYRAPHLSRFLFTEPRLNNDLAAGDPVIVSTPVSREELRSPREEDRDLGRALVAHLNEQLEHYHQAIWAAMHPNRRYMLLDGVEAPNADGRSVASVAENRVIGIVGNCLVFPVARGIHLDPTFRQDVENPVDLLHHYAPTTPVPPMRISVPTRGVFAEAVLGSCNSCETIDETRFWRWEEAPSPDQPTAIEPVSTQSRRADPPDLTPTPLPQPVVNIQNAPAAPDPLGLSGAFQVLARPDLFKDITGLEGNQRNALSAFQSALSTAKAFGAEASKLAQQQELARGIDRTLGSVQQAQRDGLISREVAAELTESALRGMVGDSRPAEQAPTDDPAVGRLIDAAAQGDRAEVSVQSPTERVDASFDGAAGGGGGGVVGSGGAARFLDIDTWVDVGLCFGETINGARDWVEPAPITTITALEARDPTRTVTVPGPPPTTVTVILGISNTAFNLGLLRVHPADATRFQVRLRARICYPADRRDPDQLAGTDVMPVVGIVHGNHEAATALGPYGPAGTRTVVVGGAPVARPVAAITAGTLVDNHLGYEYLQRELASRGIVSISVDTNPANYYDLILRTRTDLFIAGLNKLRNLHLDTVDPGDNRFNGRFAGRLNFANVGLMGHSRGGDVVAQTVVRAPAGIGITAACSVAPTDFTGTSNQAMRLNAAGLTYLVLYGSLDGDVHGHGGANTFAGTGFRHYDRATCPSAMVYLEGCTHNQFNDTWATHEPRVVTSDTRIVSRPTQKRLAVTYVGGLFRWILQGDTSRRGLFNGTVGNGTTVRPVIQWSFGDEVKTIDGGTPGSTNNNLGGARALPIGTLATFASVTVGGTAIERHVPHQTGLIHTDITVAVAVPTVVVEDIPTAPTNHQDWSTFDFLTFRLARFFDVAAATSQADITGPQPRLTLRFHHGTTARTEITQADFFTTNVPGRPHYHELRGPTANATLLRLETIRVPLPLVRRRGVDLTTVRSLAIDVDPAQDMHIFIDTIQLVRLDRRRP